MIRWLFVLVFGSALPLSAATYYVDFDNGNNAQTGTAEGTAWQHAPGDANATGKAGAQVLQPGDIVQFKAGVVYKGTVEPDDPGAPGNPVTYRGTGWGRGRAIIDGEGTRADGFYFTYKADYNRVEGLEIRNLYYGTGVALYEKQYSLEDVIVGAQVVVFE